MAMTTPEMNAYIKTLNKATERDMTPQEQQAFDALRKQVPLDHQASSQVITGIAKMRAGCVDVEKRRAILAELQASPHKWYWRFQIVNTRLVAQRRDDI